MHSWHDIIYYKRNLAVKDYLKTLISDDDVTDYYNDKVTGDIEAKHILIEVKTTDSMTEDEKRTTKEDALKKAKENIIKFHAQQKRNSYIFNKTITFIS